jgi:tripartite motif-containing protein 71
VGQLRFFGSNDNEFLGATGIGIDPQGHVFTTEQSPNNRVQKFSNTGTFIRKWGGTGMDNGQLQDPQSVAFDPQGHAFVADSGNNRIQKFSNTGGFIRTWNSTSSSPSSGSGLSLSSSSTPTPSVNHFGLLTPTG